MKNYEKLKQIIQETNSKKIKKWNKCVCGHYDRDHDDIGVFNNWGAGKCNVCSCKKFISEEKDFSPIRLEDILLAIQKQEKDNKNKWTNKSQIGLLE